MTVWRVLKKHQVKAVVKRHKKSDYIRYSKEIPGERIQLDVMKLRSGFIIEYTNLVNLGYYVREFTQVFFIRIIFYNNLETLSK